MEARIPAMCLFVRFKSRLALLPVTVRTEPLAFVVQAAETANGLRINKTDEWSAAGPEASCRILVDHHTGRPTQPCLPGRHSVHA